MVGWPAVPWHGQAPDWLELMVGDLLLLLPSALALDAALCVLFICLVCRRGNGLTTLTPEVMFIEKKQCRHIDPGKTGGEAAGEGTLGAPRGVDMASVNEVAGAGCRAQGHLPAAWLSLIR
jgi:hypothetical protein